jgi:hypothetical protein
MRRIWVTIEVLEFHDSGSATVALTNTPGLTPDLIRELLESAADSLSAEIADQELRDGETETLDSGDPYWEDETYTPEEDDLPKEPWGWGE